MNEQMLKQEVEISQDSKNLALCVWLGTLFFGFLPGIIFYLIKKDDAFIKYHAKESLNWCITAIIGYVLALIFSFIYIGILLFPIIGLCHLIFCIMGAVSASKGQDFRLPFAVRLLK